MRTLFLSSLVCFGLFAVAPAAHANVIFADDFSIIPPSRGLDPVSPPGWTIENTGFVEVLGRCGMNVLEDLLPGNDCYIDLDGNRLEDLDFFASPPGLLTTFLPMTAGYAYTLQFDLAGNQVVPFGDGVHITFGTQKHYIFRQPFEDFKTFTYTFTPATTDAYELSFVNTNVDAYGALLDNVVVSGVPAPLPLFGAAAAFGYSRHLRRRIQRGRK